MQTVSFRIPTKDIVVFKGSAKELSIDFITESIVQGGDWINCHAIVHDLTSLVSLAFISGTTAITMAIKNPLNQMIDGIERDMQTIKKNQMKIIDIAYTGTFPVGQTGKFDKIYLHGELESGDDVRQCFYSLKKQASEFFYESNKALSKEIIATTQKEAVLSPQSQTERIILDIRTCLDVKTLEAYRLIAKNTPEIQTEYNNQLKKLTNG